MNLAHVHLLLNHVPTVGVGIGLALLALSLVAGSHDDLKRASLILLFVVAILTIPAFFSGKAAEAVLHGPGDEPAFPPGVLPGAIQRHEDAALIAFTLMEITGGFAWLALWQWRGRARLPRWNLSVVLLLSIVTFGLMARAATIGGDINHPEIRAVQVVGTQGPEAGADAAAPAVSGMARAIGSVGLRPLYLGLAHGGVPPFHRAGCSLPSSSLVDLRLLGVGNGSRFPAVSQLLPLGMLGLASIHHRDAVLSGGSPAIHRQHHVLLWKVMLIVIAGVNDLYLMLCPESWAAGAGDDAPMNAKIFAASGILLWFGVLFSGHMLPFIGNAF